MTRNEAIEPFTVKDFDYLLKTNKKFKKAYDEIQFNRQMCSGKILIEIDELLKKTINEKK